MDSSFRDALRQLRTSAAEYGYPLDHLTDAEVLEGIGIVSQQLTNEGQAVALLRIGVEKVGKAFVDLQRVGYLVAN
jgi:hypothetical protein